MIATTLLPVLWLAAAGSAPAVKLPPAVSKEMTETIVAIDKALGLESWPMHGDKPCIDRGGLGATAKDVGVEETRKCAASAVQQGFPELGKSYVLAVLMAGIGPVTVIGLGTGELGAWGAYSCDPGRKCLPTKLNPENKWGKRMLERQTKACADANTVWLPAGQRACPAGAPPAASAPPPTATPAATAPPATAPKPKSTK
jgi:hypothetical protein